MNGHDLAERRRALGLSQSQLAARLRISLDTLQNWEQGRRSMGAVEGLVTLALEGLERQRMFTTIRDVYGAYAGLFGSEKPAWTLEELRAWLHEHGHTRYESVTMEVLAQAVEVSLAEMD